MKHFDSLVEYHELARLPAPEHPMLSVLSIETINANATVFSEPFTTSFYTIKYRDTLEGDFGYGRTVYDCSSGNLIFTAPRQVLQVKGKTKQKCGTVILLHEDYLKGEELARRIKNYPFFSYEVNEALHLSQKEQDTVVSIFENIQKEYANNQDEFTKELIISQLESLLKYSNRFYKRQFLNRKEMNADLGFRFQSALNDYFENESFEVKSPPSIEWIAKQLSASPRYLSEALKAETGKTAMEHLHLYLLNEAKNRLLEPGITVTEVAYQLGFEYPQYFSRLFKRKVGMSPKAYVNDHISKRLN